MHVDPHLAPRLMEVQIGFDCEALHLSSPLTRADVQWGRVVSSGLGAEHARAGVHAPVRSTNEPVKRFLQVFCFVFQHSVFLFLCHTFIFSQTLLHFYSLTKNDALSLPGFACLPHKHPLVFRFCFWFSAFAPRCLLKNSISAAFYFFPLSRSHLFIFTTT